MIFLTLGTHEQPLSRAIDVLAPLADEHEIVVQHGHTPARRDLPGFRWERFLELDQMQEHMLAADAVFCHAGVGCIMTAVARGRMPIVIPRLSALGEHVDDHQLQIASQFEARGLVVRCGLGDDPREAIERARVGRVAHAGDGALRRAVADATRL